MAINLKNEHKREQSRESEFNHQNSHLPTISIVTINYNRLKDLHQTFASVLSQTYLNVEYIIIDGGSRDGTIDFLQENDHLITYWTSEPDGGIYDAMNKGASVATGDWIIFMNAGDTFYADDTLAQAASYLDESADVVYGDVEVVAVDRYQTRISVRKPQNLTELWREMPACHQSIFVRRKLQVDYGFDASMRWCADHQLLVRLSTDRYRFREIPVIVARFDASSGENKDILVYTKERWRNSKYLASPLERHSYFLREYTSFLIWQNILRPIRDMLPAKLIVALRKYRGTG